MKVKTKLGAVPAGADADAPILRAIEQGEMREALARSARLYGNSIGRLCMALVGSQAEAEELTQETLMHAYQALRQFRGESSVRSFLFAIARRRCARHLEKRRKREAKLRLVEDSPVEPTPEQGEQLARKRAAEHARGALGRLKPSEREALVLRYQSELSYAEISKVCGCEEATARKRVSRGLVHLREVMSAETQGVQS